VLRKIFALLMRQGNGRRSQRCERIAGTPRTKSYGKGAVRQNAGSVLPWQKTLRQVKESQHGGSMTLCGCVAILVVFSAVTHRPQKEQPSKTQAADRSVSKVASNVLPAKAAEQNVSVATIADKSDDLPEKTLRKSRTSQTSVSAKVKKKTPRWDRNINHHPPKGSFVRFYRMTATAYTPINTAMEGGRWTYTEKDGRSSHGVAVDPDLIPLGTHLWIPGYGHAVADDTGGAIQGHRLDIRVQNRRKMHAWGRRQIRVYVISEP
jgi:3D (Asp-Asp-Asp) domain-containing protein